MLKFHILIKGNLKVHTNPFLFKRNYGNKRMSELLIPTQKKIEQKYSKSLEMMLKAGMIRQNAAGLYAMLPLAMLSIRKIQNIIIEELEKGGCQPVDLPILSSAKLWKISGRWEEMDKELFRLKDRKGGDYCLSPTFEEEMASLADQTVHSYRQLPLRIYQIGKKYRDEMRPRSGLLRTREFIMKDLYTFDYSSENCHKTYNEIRSIYSKIFERIGIPYRSVKADTGSIGGYLSHEYHILSDVGEDIILLCNECGYAANVELAESCLNDKHTNLKQSTNQKTFTLNDLIKELDITSEQSYEIDVFQYRTKDNLAISILLPSGTTANPIKAKLLMDKEVHESTSEIFETPEHLLIDNSLKDHPALSELQARFSIELGDLRNARDGDSCTGCGNPLHAHKAIEVAHTFVLDNFFSEPLKASCQTPDGKRVSFEMCCFGIGITRLLAAIVEARLDSRGLRWPLSIAPFQVAVIPTFPASQMSNEEINKVLTPVFEVLSSCGLPSSDVLIEDRHHLSIGFKLKDAELIGTPVQLRLNTGFLKDGILELFDRENGEIKKITLEELKSHLKLILKL